MSTFRYKAVRDPAVAGQFYASDPRTLRSVIESFIEKQEPTLEARAAVVPHAGYVYSGSVSGIVFSSVRLPRRMILLGPNHSGRGVALALSPSEAWRTPLGIVPVDLEMNRILLSECSELQEDPLAHQREHSLEVQIPFLQVLRPDFSFSAICVGTAEYEALESLGHAMARAIRTLEEPVILVASSDMTHYETAEIAARQDQFAIERVLAVDPRGLYDVVTGKDITMCGFAPTVSVLVACSDSGSSAGTLVRYTNSGHASGDFDQVVAYAGMVIGKEPRQ
jgi:AmmeMemoRadiSam system protein B